MILESKSVAFLYAGKSPKVNCPVGWWGVLVSPTKFMGFLGDRDPVSRTAWKGHGCVDKTRKKRGKSEKRVPLSNRAQNTEKLPHLITRETKTYENIGGQAYGMR